MNRALLVPVLALALGGCISLGEKPPATLMSLTPSATLAAGTTNAVGEGEAVTVLTPSVPQKLAVLRVPVQAGPTSIAYLKDAQWVESPARLFRSLLAETIAAKTGRPVLDIRQYSLAPGARLSGRLLEFGLDAPSGQAVVIYDAALAPDKGALRTRRFEARAPVASEDGPGVSAALSVASNQVAGEVADWLGR